MLTPEDLKKPEVRDLIEFLNPKIATCVAKAIAVAETVFNETQAARKDGRLKDDMKHVSAVFYTMNKVMRDGLWADPFVQITAVGYTALTGQSEASFHRKVLTAALAIVYWRSQGVGLNTGDDNGISEFIGNN